MDIEMTLPLNQRPIPDGALGDDERTETERSPLEEGKGLALGLPPRSPGEGRQEDDQDMDEDADSPDQSNNKCSRKHRRGKQKGGKRHRNWKPYVKLSWEERQKLDERETRRAYQRREQRFASGHPVAPYNTTQFLMDQHPLVGRSDQLVGEHPQNAGENNKHVDQGSNSAVDSYGSCSESYDSPNDEDIFLEKDFSEAYESFHVERLQDMSKEELIKELLDLEAKVEMMERRVNKGQSDSPSKQNNNTIDSSVTNSKTNDSSFQRVEDVSDKQISDLRTLQDLTAKLKHENELLRKENEDLLKKAVSERTTEG